MAEKSCVRLRCQPISTRCRKEGLACLCEPDACERHTARPVGTHEQCPSVEEACGAIASAVQARRLAEQDVRRKAARATLGIEHQKAIIRKGMWSATDGARYERSAATFQLWRDLKGRRLHYRSWMDGWSSGWFDCARNTARARMPDACLCLCLCLCRGRSPRRSSPDPDR
jgi:hypothetical protein